VFPVSVGFHYRERDTHSEIKIMRLGGRLQAAIEVLSDIDTRHRPVPDALKDWGLSHRFAGSGDRAAISNLVHDALRMKLSHGFVMDGDAVPPISPLPRFYGSGRSAPKS
jgi:hypothetical protein